MKNAVLSIALASCAALSLVACSNEGPTSPIASPKAIGKAPSFGIGVASAGQIQVCLSGATPSGSYSADISNQSNVAGTDIVASNPQPLTPGNCVLVLTKGADAAPGGIYPIAYITPVVSAGVSGTWSYDCVVEPAAPAGIFCPNPSAGSGNTATVGASDPHGSSITFTFTPDAPACTASSIASNFNGTAIPAGRYIWFNSTAKLSSMTNSTVLDVTNAQVTFNSGGPITVNLPPSHITFAGIASPSVTWNAVFLRWDITLPFGYNKDMFLGGGPYLSPGLPGGINPVTYSASFNSSTSGLKVQWKWAAAVYTSFSSDPGALGVGNDGKPSNFAGFAVGGARGGGAANMTGSWSGTGNAGVCSL